MPRLYVYTSYYYFVVYISVFYILSKIPELIWSN